MTSNMKEKLISDFTQNYMEKLFYFCLKKVGNSYEAEDLTQDIALNIIQALNSGAEVENFSAWVWRIARNRYSAWADKKHKKAESVTGSDIGDYEIEDESANILDEMIHSEQMSLLRRELAFINKEYRNIVVAYYIEDRRVQDIAESLSLSVGAVKMRLQRARKILKEGMDMAREFGKKSYNPEELRFASSGSQGKINPWNKVQRKIPKNVLIHASNNPSTIEELSIELGIAIPYMEEEVKILSEAYLLKKVGDKYITSFFIEDKECMIDIYKLLRKNSKRRSELVDKIVSENLENFRALGVAGDNIDDNMMKWFFTIYTADYCASKADKFNMKWPEVRENGDTWGFMGYEPAKIEERTFMGHNGCGNSKYMFWAYKISDYGMWDQIGEMCNADHTNLLGDIIENKRNIKSLSSSEKAIWDNALNGKYIHCDEYGNAVADIIVMTAAQRDKISYLIEAHPEYKELMNLINTDFERIIAKFKGYSHEILHTILPYCASMEILQIRMMTVHDAVESGNLVLPEDPNKSSFGMHLIIK